ncbi:hypothetical protein [Streptomyces sp. NPDC059564]|uniref:hypothetical protein n=1 Tax=Streptomyces sp. NPDC059564 TaxID=3346865 RepID=UPI0036B09160
MTDDEQQLAALLNDLPGHSDARFWRGLKEAAGMYRIRSTMASAVQDAQDGDFEPLAELVLEAFGADARYKDVTAVLASQLGSAVRARAWISDAIATADRINRAGAEDALDELAGKW